MKLKKCIYIIIVIMTLFIQTKTVLATGWLEDEIQDIIEKQKGFEKVTETCYYMNPENPDALKVHVDLRYGELASGEDMNDGSLAVIAKFKGALAGVRTPMQNWGSDYTTGSGYDCSNCKSSPSQNKSQKQTFEYFYSRAEIKELTSITCPKYIVVEYDTGFGLFNGSEYFVFGTNDKNLALDSEIGDYLDFKYAYASNFTTINDEEVQITEDMYYETFKFTGTDKPSEIVLICNKDILTPEIRDIIDTVLQYVRIIVPILVILLGTIDLAKASITGKEDAIKKAQSDFVKRIIMGVAVFFVPLLVDVVMDLANIVWESEGYISCNFQ